MHYHHIVLEVDDAGVPHIIYHYKRSSNYNLDSAQPVVNRKAKQCSPFNKQQREQDGRCKKVIKVIIAAERMADEIRMLNGFRLSLSSPRKTHRPQ